MVFIPFGEGQESPVPGPKAAAEIVLQRTLTSWFIAEDPTDIVLIPRITVRTPGGATQTVDGPPKPIQRVKFIYGGNTGAGRAGIVNAGDGRERMFSYVIVGEWDSDIEIADHFTDSSNQEWEIEEILPVNGYEVKAVVRSYGRSPQYG